MLTTNRTAAQRIRNSIMERAVRRYPDKIVSSSELDVVSDDIVAHYHGQRVKVSDDRGWERTGVVSSTTGWVPAFLLVHRSSDHGSWDALSSRDRLVAVWNGRRYVEVSP
jgi:hypothetical protein